MKKLILLIIILISSFTFGQISISDVIFLTDKTTVQRDAISVPSGKTAILFNTTTSQLELWNGVSWQKLSEGDMTKVVYDPTNVNGDAFSMDNMVEGATTKILTSTERTAIGLNTAKNTYPSADATKVGNLTVTQPVDLDTMESDVSTNNSKVSNVNHTGDATGATGLTLATVNSNVGSFTAADITVNAKGLITAAANGSGGEGGPTTVYKASDENRVGTTTPTLDSELQVELDANSFYQFEINYYYISSSSVPDLKFSLEAPAGATGGYIAILEKDNPSGPEDLFTTEEIANTASLSFPRGQKLHGRIITTNSGTFGFKWSQNNSGATATTLTKGSNLIIFKLN